MATASPWTHNQVALAFQSAPELKSLLLHDVEDTGELVGSGSYGVVVKLRVAGATFCAGKKIHEILIDQRYEGAKDMVINFFMECKLMSELRHPNIVQFIGVCLMPSPVLVTELLTDCLHNYLETRKNLPLSMKLSFLIDVASALVYLHSGIPPIIHRDLTAKNVLIDERGMKAKITDLGNSRFIGKPGAKMTRAPGTLVYMSPEALEEHSVYCDKLDMFSFGHLSLYALTQVYPEHLLAPNIPSSKTEKLTSRSEVERRAPYIEILDETLGGESLLVKLVKQCLSNIPQKRPTAMQVVEHLEDMDPDYDDVQTVHRAQMLDIINKKDKEIKFLKKEMLARDTELDLVFDAGVVKSGPLEKLSTRVLMRNKSKKWKPYIFKLNNAHLRCFNSWIKRGEIVLSSVSNVVIVPRRGRGKYCFDIHFEGSDSPWTLAAKSVEERRQWIDDIRKNTPKMKTNEAYGLVQPPTGFVAPKLAVNEPEYDVIVAVPQPSQVIAKQPALPNRPVDLGKNPTKLNDKASVGAAGKYSDAVGTQQASSGTKKGREESDSQLGNKKPSLDSLKKTKPDYDMTYATLNRKAINFTPHQIKHLIDMLKNTQKMPASETEDKKEDKKAQDEKTENKGDKSDPESLYVQPYYVNYMEMLDDDDEHDFREDESTRVTLPRSSSYYVNYQDVCDRERRLSRCELSECEKVNTAQRPRSASPTSRNHFYINYSELLLDPVPQRGSSQSDIHKMPDDTPKSVARKLPMPPPKPSLFSGFQLQPLPAVNNSEQQQQTLKNILRQGTLKHDPESLLVTEDDNDYLLRPQWAKANTSHLGPNTLAALHRKELYISPKFLTKMTHLGEGRFGMVYKAEMKKFKRNRTVAVKSVAHITDDFRKEVTIMSEVVHPNIVRLYGLVNEGDMAPAMVMEYLPNGDLKEFLSKNSRDEPQLMKYMIDVAMGMHYLSDKGIIHRDLAARNVLVDRNEMCKVADFGLVREVPRDSMFYVSRSQGPSPLRWMAPESISKRIFSPASDIWSYGILQWEMFNPKKLYPYPSLQNEEIVKKVTDGYLMPTPRNAPQLVVRIMKACWNSQPDKRPSFLLIANLLTGEMISND